MPDLHRCPSGPARAAAVRSGRRLARLLSLPLAAVVALAVPVASAHAQGQIGVLLGATYSSLRGIDGLDSRTGLVGGASIVLPSSGLLAFQPEALFVNKGAKASTGDPEGLKLSYFELPLLLRLRLGGGEGSVHPHAYAGPYLGIQIDCSVQGNSADCDDVPGVSTKSVDVGGVLGGGLDFDFGPLVLTGGARYSFGVSKVADFEFSQVRESARNGTFALYAGAAIRLGSR